MHKGHLAVNVLNQPDEGHGLVRVLNIPQAFIYEGEALQGEARLGVAATE